MTIGTPLVTFCLRATLFSLPLLTFLIGWTGGVSRSLEILFSGSAPQTAVWANSWDDLRKHTARSIGILLTCATCFIIYGAHQKKTFLDTTRDIGFTVFSKHSITMLCFAFSGWYVSHFGAEDSYRLVAYWGSDFSRFMASSCRSASLPQAFSREASVVRG